MRSVAARPVSTARVVVRMCGVAAIIVLLSVALFRGAGSRAAKTTDSRVAAAIPQTATAPTGAALASITDVASAPEVSNTVQSNSGDGLRNLEKCSREPEPCVELPEVKQRLEMLLGDLLHDFDDKLTTSQQGVLDGHTLTVSGCQPHACATTGAAFTINFDTGATVAAVHEGNVMTVYGAVDKTFDALPNGLRSWIINRQPEMDEMAQYRTKPDRIVIRFW